MKRLPVIYFTPFIASFNNAIYGVLLLFEQKGLFYSDWEVYKIFDIISGSSILFVAYLIATSKKMCIYYKCSCWLLMIMHIISLIYLYTPIKVITYIYAITILSMISLVASTAAILGRKTCRTIVQYRKRL